MDLKYVAGHEYPYNFYQWRQAPQPHSQRLEETTQLHNTRMTPSQSFLPSFPYNGSNPPAAVDATTVKFWFYVEKNEMLLIGDRNQS